MRAKGQTESEVLREMVAAGLFYNRVGDTSRDEARKRVRDQQQQVVRQELAPLINHLEMLDQFLQPRVANIDRNMRHTSARVDELQESSGLLLRAAATIMYNIVHIRAGMWNFVTTLYFRTISKLSPEATQAMLLQELREHATSLKTDIAANDIFDETKLAAMVERSAGKLNADLRHKFPER